MKNLFKLMTVTFVLFSTQAYAQGKDKQKKDSKVQDEMISQPYEQARKTCNGMAEGSTREGYISDSTTGDVPCPKGTQTCLNGQWVGPSLFDNCINNTKNCGSTVHGGVVQGFLQGTVQKGFSCTPAFKTCLNGSWIGPEVYPTCTEAP